MAHPPSSSRGKFPIRWSADIRIRRLGLQLACVALVLAAAGTPSSAISVIPPTFEELVSGAGEIARGRVVSAEAFRTISRDGTPIIKTRVTWQVISSLKGDVPGTLSLDFLGGRVDGEEMRIGGMPQFAEGEEDFLFVEPNTGVFCPLFAAGHGRYRILNESKTGRAYVARDNGEPLLDTARVDAPLESVQATRTAQASAALTPEAFERAIRDAIEGRGTDHAK